MPHLRRSDQTQLQASLPALFAVLVEVTIRMKLHTREACTEPCSRNFLSNHKSNCSSKFSEDLSPGQLILLKVRVLLGSVSRLSGMLPQWQCLPSDFGSECWLSRKDVVASQNH